MKRLLVTGDPAAVLDPRYDTTLLLIAEALRRGWLVDYCDLTTTAPEAPSWIFLAGLPVQSVRAVTGQPGAPLKLGALRVQGIGAYTAAFHRKDPPVDAEYIAYCRQFMAAPASLLQVNDPAHTWTISEHLLPLEFPELSAPTFCCDSFESLLATVRAVETEAVLKPMHLFAGTGIEFFPKHASPEALRAYWTQWGPQVVVQPFLPEIERSGDLRVLVMNGRIVGSVLRKPREGCRLANIHKGAVPHPAMLTETQRRSSELIARKLGDRGLRLLGIDFIGDLVTEINVTCPSAVPQINAVMGIRAEVRIFEELESIVDNEGQRRSEEQRGSAESLAVARGGSR